MLEKIKRRVTRLHLQWAIELEHFTLPPYLCALYSLDAVRNREASEVVSSVLVEEMLHGSMYCLKAQAQAPMEMRTEDGMTDDRTEGSWPHRFP